MRGSGTLCAKERPTDAHDDGAQHECLELEGEHVLAAGLGCYLVLADRPQHAAPRGLDRSFHRQEEERQNDQDHDQVEVVVVLRCHPLAQELGYPVQALGPVGKPLLVEEEQPDGFPRFPGSLLLSSHRAAAG